MKKLLFALCAVLLVGCVAIRPMTTDATANIELDVCYSSISAAQVVALYAQEKGLYAQYGLDVNLVYVDGGSTAVTTLVAGEMDICQVGGAPLANAVVAGEELVMVAGLFNRYAYALMVMPEIETPEALKGKALAISSPGSSSDSALRALLPTLGLEADKDVAILDIGGQSSRMAAMEAGGVAGTLVSVPESAIARELGYHELANMLAFDLPYPHNGIATSRRFIAENRETVMRFLQATVASIVLMKADQAGTIALLAEFLQMDAEADRAALEEAYRVFVVEGLEIIPYPTEEGIQRQLDAMVADNANAANVSAADLVDTTLLAELEASGFVAQLENK